MRKTVPPVAHDPSAPAGERRSTDYVFRTVWRVAGSTTEVKDVLGDARTLAGWMPSVYLSVEVLNEGGEGALGRVVRLHTKGWLPYTLRWTLTMTEPVTDAGFALEAAGDLNGTGRWTFVQEGPEVEIAYDWRVSAAKPVLRRLSWLLKPAFAANHRWAMARGEESLKLELRRRRAATETERRRIPAPPGPTFWPGSRRPRSEDLAAEPTTGSMAGKTVLVTGGTGGIGRATAAGLAALGAHVAIVGRDRERAERTARDIRAPGGPAVDVFVADLSSQAEVRRLAEEVLGALARIDVLVNDVGGYWHTRHTTADGFERTFALNHLAPFLLTNLLLDRLKESSPARVVTVASGAHAMGRINFADLQGQRSYSGQRAYSQSKLANVLFTYELARRLRGTGVTTNALHPGVVRTGFGAEDPGRMQRVFAPLGRRFLKSPEQGAQTPILLASAPELALASGEYFANGKPKRSSKQSYDEATAARLWRISADLVGVQRNP